MITYVRRTHRRKIQICKFENDADIAWTRLRDNEAAYDRYKIRPRILCDVSDVDTRTRIFGADVSLDSRF